MVFCFSKKKIAAAFVVLAVLLQCALPLMARAAGASLYFSPRGNSYTVGATFSTSIYLSSADQASNAISGVITFPKDKLSVVSVSKSGSIMSLWVQEPSFSNSAGTVNFEGIVLNPGYKGSGGKVITITFKTKAVGTANVAFSSGSILANDGQGTNILSGLGNASFTIKSAIPEQKPQDVTTPTLKPEVPLAPKIDSSSHPDSSVWYNDNDPEFKWSVGSDITGVSLSLTPDPVADPGTRSLGIFGSYTAKDVKDGEQYVHIRLANKNGWGSISHRLLKIDTTPPQQFTISLADSSETVNPAPVIRFSTTDSPSGVKEYRVKIDNGTYVSVAATSVKDGYALPPLDPGKHTIIVEAVDYAGNRSVATTEVTIKAIQPPQFTEYPSEAQKDAVVVIKGLTYPLSTVVASIGHDNATPTDVRVASQADGSFSFPIPERAKVGVYHITARVLDTKGAQSNPSQQIVIPIKESAAIVLGSKLLIIAAIAVILFALLILVVVLLLYVRHKYREYKKRIHAKTTEADALVHQSFGLLRARMKEYLDALRRAEQNRPLTAEEQGIMKKLEEDITLSEDIIVKEVDSVEKVL